MKRLNLCIMSAGLLLGACSKSTHNEPAEAAKKQEKAEAKLCKNMIHLQTTVQQYPDVTAETPIATIEEANAGVEKAVNEVREAAQDVSNPRILEVQSAYQELQNNINNMPEGTETVGEVADSLRADAQEFRNAWDRLYMSMECGA
jgi:hypothetical protein